MPSIALTTAAEIAAVDSMLAAQHLIDAIWYLSHLFNPDPDFDSLALHGGASLHAVSAGILLEQLTSHKDPKLEEELELAQKVLEGITVLATLVRTTGAKAFLRVRAQEDGKYSLHIDAAKAVKAIATACLKATEAQAKVAMTHRLITSAASTTKIEILS